MKNIKYTLIFQLLLIVIIFINYKKNIFNVDIEKAIFVGIFICCLYSIYAIKKKM